MSLEDSMQAQPAFDGKPANVVTLHNAKGMSVSFMDIGATWISARVPVGDGAHAAIREVLLGVSDMASHQHQAAYLGASVGRYANRIAKGRFIVDGKEFQVDCNQAGNCLHGGEGGFNTLRWHLDRTSADQVTFSLISADGDQGFPGLLNASVTYQLTDENEVVVTYHATTDKACPVNLTNHAYFNLMGAESGESCLDHSLMVNADYYLPTDAVGIPLQGLEAVDGTSFDFRTAKPIGRDLLADDQQKQVKGYDHSFYFDHVDDDIPRATLVSPDNQLTLTVYSNQPAIQVYSGNWLAGTPARDGFEYGDYAGVALETQVLPDSPNHPEWAQDSCILRPGKRYTAKTVFHFQA